MRSRNFTLSLMSCTAPSAANVEFTVAPGLVTDAGLVIPQGFVVVRRNVAALLYRSATTWTSSAAYLKSDTGSASFVVGFFV